MRLADSEGRATRMRKQDYLSSVPFERGREEERGSRDAKSGLAKAERRIA